MSDKKIICKDCGKTFLFTECRAAKKQQPRGGNRDFNKAPRKMFTVKCSKCGITTSVPFQPTGDKPVYCKDCYQPKSRY